MQKKLCFLCLKPNHRAKNCNKTFICFKCKGKHHVIICNYATKESDDKKVDSDDGKRNVEDETEKG